MTFPPSASEGPNKDKLNIREFSSVCLQNSWIYAPGVQNVTSPAQDLLSILRQRTLGKFIGRFGCPIHNVVSKH